MMPTNATNSDDLTNDMLCQDIYIMRHASEAAQVARRNSVNMA
jgi:hypothetical protein